MNFGLDLFGSRRRESANLGHIQYAAVCGALEGLNEVGASIQLGNDLIADLLATGAGDFLFHRAKKLFDPKKAGSCYWFSRFLFRLAAVPPKAEDALTGTIRFFDKYGARALKEEKDLIKPPQDGTIKMSFENLLACSGGDRLVQNALYETVKSKNQDIWTPGVRYPPDMISADPMFQLLVWSGRSGLPVIEQLFVRRAVAEKPLRLALARMDSSEWARADFDIVWEILCLGDFARMARKGDQCSLACFTHFEHGYKQHALADRLAVDYPEPDRWDTLQIAACVPYTVEDDLREAPLGYEEEEPLQCALIKLAAADLPHKDHALEAQAVCQIRDQKLFNDRVDIARRWAANPSEVDLLSLTS